MASERSDAERVLLAVAQLAVVFRVAADQPYLRAYCQALEGLAAVDVVAACESVARTRTDGFMPPPGVIREEASKLALRRFQKQDQERLQLQMRGSRKLTDGERKQIARALGSGER